MCDYLPSPLSVDQAMHRVHRVQSMYDAIESLARPDRALDDGDRANLSILMAHLSEQHYDAMGELEAAMLRDRGTL